MFITMVQSLALASVAWLSPGSITLVILLLMAGDDGQVKRGWHNGVAFLFGYLVMYSLIGAGVLVLGVNSTESASSEQSIIASYIFIGLGIVLLGFAYRNWRKKPSTVQTEQPSRFARLVDGITPLKAFGLAAFAAAVNLKNMAIFLSAVSVLLLSDLLLVTKLTLLLPLVLVFCISIIVPIGIYLLFPRRASDYLTRIKDSISRHSRSLGISLMLILGVLFLYRGFTGL